MDPNSQADVATLTTNTSYPKLGSDPTQYTFPVYDVTTSTPTLPVYLASIWSNVTAPSSLTRTSSGQELQIPIPANAQPASGSDSQVIVVDPATGDEWGFWEFINANDPLSAASSTGATSISIPNAYSDYDPGQQVIVGYGSPDAETATIASNGNPGSTQLVFTAPLRNAHAPGEVVWGMSATNGYHYNTIWSGVPPTGFASRGAGVPYLAGLVRPCEIAQGHIDHALAFSYQNNSSAFVYPATKSDGGGTGMPEGSHLQLDPSISDTTIQSWGCTGACFTIAKALQKYGAYDIDNGGHPKIYLEDDSTANWGTTVSASTTNPIPLSAFRVIDG